MNFIVSALSFLLLSAPLTKAAEIDALEIMKKNYFVSKVVGSQQTVTMILTTESGQKRVRKTKGITKLQKNGNDNTQLVRFLSPADVKNTANLLIEHSKGDDDIWIYLPALKKVRRIVSSNKKDSFAGSDFSYGDIIGQRVESWNHKFIKEDVKDSAKVYLIESTPKDDTIKSSSGYSKVLYTIRQDNFATIKGEYWDTGDRLLKEIIYSELKEVDPSNKKWQAMKVEAKNFQTGHKTDIIVDEYKLDPNVKDEHLTTRYLEKEQ